LERRRILIIIVGIVVVALLGYGLLARHLRLTALEHLAAEQSILPVEIINPTAGAATRSISLPGTVRAWYEAPIFAQVSGYVRNWYEDYGADVKAGQLLATIDTPGLDADYAAARARLHVAQTKYKLAATTAARWQALAGTPAVSKQSVDVETAGAEAVTLAKGDAVVVPASLEKFTVRPQWTIELLRARVPGAALPEPETRM